MQVINAIDLADTIDAALDLDMPLMIWGAAGAGKSSIVAQRAAARNAILCEIRTSQYDSVDFRGLPSMVDMGNTAWTDMIGFPSVHNGVTVWNKPSTMPFVGNNAFPDNQEIVLFLDEITSSSTAVFAVLYQLVLDHKIGEHTLKPNVRIIAAGNRDGDKGVTTKMPLPLADRFDHVELGVDPKAVVEHMIEAGVPAVCAAFLAFREPLVHTYDPAKPVKVFATPRSWMAAFKVYASDVSDRVKRIMMSGQVGEGPALEFWAFVDTVDKVIPISAIIADPHHAPLPEEASMRYATAVSISGSLDLNNSTPLHTYLCRMDSDFMILAWQMALRRNPALVATKEFMHLATEYREIFKR